MGIPIYSGQYADLDLTAQFVFQEVPYIKSFLQYYSLFCLGGGATAVKNVDDDSGPVVIHVVTEKGYGYEFAEQASDRMHGVAKYDPASGKQVKTSSKVRAQDCTRMLIATDLVECQ